MINDQLTINRLTINRLTINNEGTVRRNGGNYGLSFLIPLFSFLILFACQNPADVPAKMGRLSLSINGQNEKASAALSARTVLPGTVTFSKCELAFTAKTTGNTSFTETWTDNNSGSIDLNVGTWDLAVTGFNSSDQEVASGTLTNLTVQAGTVSESITLEPIAGGTGTFTWDITFEAGIASGSLALVAVDGSDNAGHNETLNPSGAQSGSAALSPGQYRASFTLSDGTATRVITEIVHIYRNLTSNFTGTFIANFPRTITYSAAQTGGASDTADSTAIVFTFSENIEAFNIVAEDIVISSAAEKNGAAITVSGNTLTVPITVSSQADAWVTINKTGIEAEQKFVPVYKSPWLLALFTQGNAIIYPDMPLDDLKNRLLVSLLYSVATPQILSQSEYTLSGELTPGISTITVSAQGYTDTFTVEVSAGSAIGIPVVTVEVIFFQLWNDIHFDVYQDTPLDNLKNRLVVSLLTDGANPQVLSQTEYTLSGELTLGINTIAVTTRDGYTGTFTVEVSAGSVVGTTIVTVEATYAQRGKIYPNVPLDNLKNTLMVMLLYDGVNPQMMSRSEYELYGAFHIGTNNVAVISQGYTSTFIVEISPPRNGKKNERREKREERGVCHRATHGGGWPFVMWHPVVPITNFLL